jgi:hypothetical protein
MPDSVTIQSRFNGPLDSGNGGYAAGLIAGLIEGAAEVSLRSPVPLDKPLAAVRDEDGVVEVSAGDTLVARARSASSVDVDVPAAVSISEAREATERYRGKSDGPFSHCFVCGREREDAFGVFAGAVDGRDVVASPWTPSAEFTDHEGDVLPEFLWAVLDCPTYFALYPGSNPLSFLAQISARVDAPVKAGVEHVVIAWPIDKDGRKHHAGSAILSAEGEPLAAARALLIEARPA